MNLYSILTSHLHIQYARDCAQFGHEVRSTILEFLLKFRSDSEQRVGCCLKRGEGVSYSAFVICASAEESPPMSPAPFQVQIKTQTFSFKKILNVLAAAIGKEKFWPILKKIFDQLPQLLVYRYLILTDAQGLENLAKIVLLEISSKDEKVSKLIEAPEKFEAFDFVDELFPVLAAFVSYQAHLDEQVQLKLAMAIQKGLVSPKSVTCVLATITCIL